MPSLTVLHLSDLHWHTAAEKDLGIVLDALGEDLDRLRKEEGLSPDVIVFSGDLALAADTNEWLQEAYERFLSRLVTHQGLTFDKVFVAPGNHDIGRERVRSFPSIQKTLESELTDLSAINRFLDKVVEAGSEKEIALSRMNVFYEAHDSYHPEPLSKDFPHHLRTFKVNVGSHVVGVACFNSAFLATGEKDDVDYGKLVVGERVVDQALKDLEGSDFRIAVHHHPDDWLVQADRAAFDLLLRKSFHLNCCGHMHANRPHMSMDAIGTCITSQTGSLFAGRSWFNGYTIIEVDIPSGLYKFRAREYHNNRRAFDAATSLAPGGIVELKAKISDDPRREDQIELIMRANREAIRQNITEHLNLTGGIEGDAGHRPEQFICPPIVKHEHKAEDETEKVSVTEKFLKLEDIVGDSSNSIILGDRNVGKTTVALMLAYTAAFKSIEKSVVPIYIDARTYKYNMYSLRKAITNFLDLIPDGLDLDAAIKDGIFLIILDNVDPNDTEMKKFAEHLKNKELGETRWILIASPNSASVSPERVYNEAIPDFVRYQIRPLNRARIRALTKRWCSRTNLNPEQAFAAVMEQITRDGLPRSPYMVSLLLWAMQQKQTHQKVNEALLLGNIVDHLLGKADFRLSKRGMLNPVGKEITLQNLAAFLHEKFGVASENEVTAFLIDFFDKKRLPYIGGDVLDKLIECGILKRDSDVISFKYRYFGEYFFALQLRQDRAKLKFFLTDINFLEVRRELELLAGIQQQNDELISSIERVLDERTPQHFDEICPSNFDSIGEHELDAGTTRKQLNKIRRTRLTTEQLDEMMDEADRRAMERGDRPVTDSLRRADGDIVGAAKEREGEAISADKAAATAPLRPATHMAAIDLLARIIRNSDFTDYEIKGPAVRLVLKSWIKILLIIRNEFEEILQAVGNKTGEKIPADEIVKVKYLVSKFVFQSMGNSVISQMSTPTMADTLHSLIDGGELMSGERILALFLLEDIDDPEWQRLWSSVIRNRSASSFVVDTIIDRLWQIATNKALDDDQVGRVHAVANDIEKRLNWSSGGKSDFLQNVKDASTVAALKDAHENVEQSQIS